MSIKLAFRNVKKHCKDYTVYFVTIVFAVAIFYMFNSIGHQPAMQLIADVDSRKIKTIVEMISLISLFISVILAFLIIYANHYLIKRRKKEFGIYLLVGGEYQELSKILVLETTMVGIISLVLGLGVGVFLSQGMGVLVSLIFHTALGKLTFVFSAETMLKVILYFTIIFSLVSFLNVLSLGKLKLIDLLGAQKKHEKLKVQKNLPNVILFILSILMIGVAHYIGISVGLNMSNGQFLLAAFLATAGTFGFYRSLAGFMMWLTKGYKKFYFKEINMFVVRQLTNKISTNYIAISIISIMLFITMTTLATGINTNEAITKNLAFLTPFDHTVVTYDEETTDLLRPLKENNIGFDAIKDTVTYAYYKTEQKVGEFLQTGMQYPFSIVILKESDYNKVQAIRGKEVIALKEDECMFLTGDENIFKQIRRRESPPEVFELKGYQLKNYGKDMIYDSLENHFGAGEWLSVVVPDFVAEGLEITRRVTNFNIIPYDQSLNNKIEEIYNRPGIIGHYLLDSRKMIQTDSYMMSGMLIFVALYIGLVFLVASGAILAIQQLSDGAESVERFQVLRKIGCSEEMLKWGILKQVSIYFLLPLIIALAHTVVGIYIIVRAVLVYYSVNIWGQTIAAIVGILILYLLYMYATYVGYKNMISKN